MPPTNNPNLMYPGSPDAPEAMPGEEMVMPRGPLTSLGFVASFVIAGELYGVDELNFEGRDVWRWDVDESKWLKAGTIYRDG